MEEFMKWVNMMMPEPVRVNTETQSGNFAEVEIAPLERGFGHTLGNAIGFQAKLQVALHGEVWPERQILKHHSQVAVFGFL